MINCSNKISLNSRILIKRKLYLKGTKTAYLLYSLIFYDSTSRLQISSFFKTKCRIDIFLFGRWNINVNSSKSEIAREISKQIIITRFQSTKINPKYINYF